MNSHRGKRSSLPLSSSRFMLFIASRARVQHPLPCKRSSYPPTSSNPVLTHQIVRAVARLYELTRTTRLSATASSASMYITYQSHQMETCCSTGLVYLMNIVISTQPNFHRKRLNGRLNKVEKGRYHFLRVSPALHPPERPSPC